eukprot:scaffold4362_cov390-Prasinococcus_capsulatus_cf.AAC.3
MYDRRISEYATEQFKARQRKGEYIELVLNSRVTETRPGTILPYLDMMVPPKSLTESIIPCRSTCHQEQDYRRGVCH